MMPPGRPGHPLSEMSAVPTAGHEVWRVEKVFAACFARQWRTRLIGGASEPFYSPARETGEEHLLHYRSDYFASALHESAHWCIAGPRRRALPDFGYWYTPDGRNATQQIAFEAVEARPQALEWFFSAACGYRFVVSADNLGAGESPEAEASKRFEQKVLAAALHWQRIGLPDRAALFFAALSREFGTGLRPADIPFTLSGLN